MPNALMEAMALGLPCISTECPCGGARAIIKNGENGILVNCNEKNALASSMLTLLNKINSLVIIGQAARNTASVFEPNRIFKLWETYILDL